MLHKLCCTPNIKVELPDPFSPKPKVELPDSFTNIKVELPDPFSPKPKVELHDPFTDIIKVKFPAPSLPNLKVPSLPISSRAPCPLPSNFIKVMLSTSFSRNLKVKPS